MKKLLEVLLYGDNDVRFNTDFDVRKNPEMIPMISSMCAQAFLFKLWGGNETSVIAMLRALTIADLAVSVNRAEMLEQLGEAAEVMHECLDETKREMEKKGYKFQEYSPILRPSHTKS